MSKLHQHLSKKLASVGNQDEKNGGGGSGSTMQTPNALGMYGGNNNGQLTPLAKQGNMTPVTNNAGMPTPSPLVQGLSDDVKSRFAAAIFNALPMSKKHEMEENADLISQRRGSNVSATLPQLHNNNGSNFGLLRQTSKQYGKNDSRVLAAQTSQVSNGNNKAKMAMPIVLTKNGSPQS